MKPFNIYLCGVGGQGIGLISEIILRAADRAGLKAIGVDTHGLAQRGGIVSSHIRIGESVHSPLVSKRKADLVISLERHEAVRAASEYLTEKGSLVYYNTSWQPLPVRLKKAQEISVQQVADFCEKCEYKLFEVYQKDLPDPRMQNIALLAAICRNNLVAGLATSHYEQAMGDLMSGRMLDANLQLFNRLVSN
ncbi:MAG: pyruvate ferredoxin oxidoreductase [Candidatus Riflebacteria bacterium HGW-Riflebacteria-1]|jgi:indolepyruvate ferredoxin oxidoreductase beta subunit|nr:MAG: pyruvate ferredoxin oxidoreductase [Candidatus Riflebacteria bacterium HGW-Riflebacteria-1]